MNYRKGERADLDRCVEIRGLTRDNAIDKETLVLIGVTYDSWGKKIENEIYVGFVAEDKGKIIAFCFGDTNTGEVLVLAVLPDYEGAGAGSKLLALVSDKLLSVGFFGLYLAASPDPKIRAHGFYRRVGWQPTQTYDENGDEILTYQKIRHLI